jgi:hypothetical protein
MTLHFDADCLLATYHIVSFGGLFRIKNGACIPEGREFLSSFSSSLNTLDMHMVFRQS